MADPTLDLEGDAAIPRSNGEPVFSAPWQSRAFGMAMVLHEQGAFEWDDFRAQLIAEIDRVDAGAGSSAAIPDDEGSLYYSSWLAALSAVLTRSGFVPASELTARSADFLSGARDEVH